MAASSPGHGAPATSVAPPLRPPSAAGRRAVPPGPATSRHRRCAPPAAAEPAAGPGADAGAPARADRPARAPAAAAGCRAAGDARRGPGCGRSSRRAARFRPARGSCRPWPSRTAASWLRPGAARWRRPALPVRRRRGARREQAASRAAGCPASGARPAASRPGPAPPVRAMIATFRTFCPFSAPTTAPCRFPRGRGAASR
ncbi:hypothetical protein D3C85_553230 [compost metagenome]